MKSNRVIAVTVVALFTVIAISVPLAAHNRRQLQYANASSTPDRMQVNTLLGPEPLVPFIEDRSDRFWKDQGHDALMCLPYGSQCLPWAKCCPGLTCVPASTRAFCL